jgi:peptidoglycan/LPS O-acetylase OafA/YrhL
MSLHCTLASDSASAQRFRRLIPLAVIAGLAVLALAPGAITGDRPFQASLCADQQQAPEACAELWRAASAPTDSEVR